MDKVGFKDFLSRRYKKKNGNRLTEKAIGDCVSRARRIEKLLGIDLDHQRIDQAEFTNIILKLKSSDLSSKITNFGVLDCTNALKKYRQFQDSASKINHLKNPKAV